MNPNDAQANCAKACVFPFTVRIQNICIMSTPVVYMYEYTLGDSRAAPLSRAAPVPASRALISMYSGTRLVHTACAKRDENKLIGSKQYQVRHHYQN